MTTFASLFGGGGLADVGAMAAGCVPLWTVEYSPAIAQWHCKNVPGEVVVAAVEDVDPASLPVPDILWASPSCKRASVANMQGESAEDSSAADAVCRFLRVMRPKGFILENVRGYRTFAAMNLIRAALTECGYWWDETVQNSADYQVPQTRHRFILRAVLGGFLPPYPSPLPWVGWYAAIEDLIPTLPPSQFAKWQMARLGDLTALGTSIVECDHSGRNGPLHHAADSTAPCVTGKTQKAFLLEGGAFLVSDQSASAGEGVQVRDVNEPCVTVRAGQSGGAAPKAFLHGNGTRSTPTPGDEPADAVTSNSNQTGVRAWLSQGRVVATTPRALARFMSLPDWYELPAKNGLAVTIIGNGVPCLMAEAIVRTVREAIQ